MKRICFVTTISLTFKAFLLDVSKYLYENGNYEITMICDKDEELIKQLPEYIRYIPIKMKRGIDFSCIKSIYKLYTIFKKEKFDIVQYSTPNAALYSSIAAFLARTKIRLYCQMGVRYVGFKGIKRKIFKLIEKIVCSLSTYIEPVSLGNLEFGYKEKLYNEKKSSVIWNGSSSGVNLEKFNVKNKLQWRKAIREKYKIDEECFVFGFVGRIDKDKGFNELLEAFKKLLEEYENINLMIVGNNDKMDKIDKELYEWSIKDRNVIYCGITKEVEKHLAAMDAFVLPSYREGFASVVIEAEAMGIPVIVTNIPGPTDAMIKDKTGIIVEKANIESLFKGMKKMIENDEMRLEMSKEAILLASEKFESKQLFEYILKDRDALLQRN
ncbi:MAG: glycosyltransferase family 4 protein [Clostridia bacterium]